MTYTKQHFEIKEQRLQGDGSKQRKKHYGRQAVTIVTDLQRALMMSTETLYPSFCTHAHLFFIRNTRREGNKIVKKKNLFLIAMLFKCG